MVEWNGGFILVTLFLFWEVSRAAYVLLSLIALGYLVRYKPRLTREERF
jgi:hypothetical protein